MALETGTVLFFHDLKGFGFIRPDDGSKDVYLNIAAVDEAGLETVREGQRVSYGIKERRTNPGRFYALNLGVIPAEIPPARPSTTSIPGQGPGLSGRDRLIQAAMAKVKICTGWNTPKWSSGYQHLLGAGEVVSARTVP